MLIDLLSRFIRRRETITSYLDSSMPRRVECDGDEVRPLTAPAMSR